MKLESVYERHKVIDGLIKKSFKLDALWVHDQENTDDWFSNMEIMKNLISIDDLMSTESIFLDAFDEMESVPSRSAEEKEYYLGILFEHLTHFVDTLLLHLIEFTFDDLKTWQFKTEVGQKFHKDVEKKLNALIKKYQDIYDL